MNRLRLSRDAFKNMMRAAARDPLWAFLALITMPFRIWKRLLGFMFILFIVTFVIGMGGGHFLEQMGFERGSLDGVARPCAGGTFQRQEDKTWRDHPQR